MDNGDNDNDSDNDVNFIETCIHLIDELLIYSPELISEPDFYDRVHENIKELFCFGINCIGKEEDGGEEEDMDMLIDCAIEMIDLPPRSYSYTFPIHKSEQQLINITNQITVLQNTVQPAQRTNEWYQFRHNLITASNAYKAFESQSVQNQLIYEKCLPIPLAPASNKPVNVDTAMHWGQKFEPVSVMYYEYMYQTKVSDFGCIQHPKYSYLGASPDGIMSNPDLPRYGRMLEIKNIVNRDIDGIPKKEYWIQMQLQMETCDLDECDFLETRFVEYPSSSEYYLDKDKDTDNSDIKGIIMYFSTDDGKPIYIYKPLCMSQFHFDNVWENEMMEKYSTTMTWIRNIYWKLDEVSCVLVLRNKRWFHDNLETLSTIWTTILTERNEGYSHRVPNKRVKTVVVESESGGGYLGNKM